ncbi:hypothetical protein GCM10009854_04230 [Saccharopolyspora halophila]|uniref:Uncharacterized protein n=1 Tax=Saccharopolyspora halophila TaxID=405551 RepID=A0ABN3FK94_9PSEU
MNPFSEGAHRRGGAARPEAQLPRALALVGIVFGAVFVLVNAGGLPGPWDGVARIAGVCLIVTAAWRGLIRARPLEDTWPGSARAYWIAVGVEIVAIPAGAVVLNRVLELPDLVVLWVVFVVGAHFLPARMFAIGRYAELGVVLMLLAVGSAAAHLAAGLSWVPSLGAVLAGMVLLAFAAIPALAHPGTRS